LENRTDYRRRRRAPRWGRIAVVAAALVIIVAAVVGVGLYLSSRYSEKASYSVEVTARAKGDYQSMVTEFEKENPKLKTVGGGSPDFLIDTRKRPGYSYVLLQTVPGLRLKAGEREVTVGPKSDYYLLFKDNDRFTRRLSSYLEGAPPEITLTACGDIITGRHVAERMAQHGVYYPFEKVAPYTKGADIIYGVLECPLSDRVEAPYTGTEFLAPSNTIEGIKLCGFNILALANNHSTNFGRQVFTDTLDLLKSNNIRYVGGGKDSTEAFSPTFMDVKGVRFAFLDYNSITGSASAGANQAGVADIRMKPWFTDDPKDIELVKNAISEARKKSDVVVVGFHWGKEDEYLPGESMKKMAHNAVDAGADLVIGTHPHSVESFEYYNGKVIAYSLGNFVFDQMYMTSVREGVIMKCRFSGADLTSVELVPYKIYDFCQPNVLTGSSGQYLLDHVMELSGFTY